MLQSSDRLKGYCEEAKEWLRKPINKQLFWDEPCSELGRFVKGEAVLPGAVAFDLKQISEWFFVHAESSAVDDASVSLSSLRRGLHYQVESVKTLVSINAIDKRHRKQGKLGFNEGGLCLARAIALGYSEEAEILNSGMVEGLHNGLFYGFGRTTVAPFVFGLYSNWRETTLSYEGLGVKTADVYEKLLECWRTTNLKDLVPALESACEYHVLRSQEQTDEETFEFDSFLDKLYAFEILALLRLRQQLGLSISGVDHPLLTAACTFLKDVQPFPEDQFLRSVCEKNGT